MTAVWPATLPQCPILNAFTEEKQINIAAFSPDVGPPRMSRRSTAAAWLTGMAYRMTTTQLTDFNLFYETTLLDGNLPFTWAHPITKTNYDWIFDPRATPRIDRMTPRTHRVQFNLLRLP